MPIQRKKRKFLCVDIFYCTPSLIAALHNLVGFALRHANVHRELHAEHQALHLALYATHNPYGFTGVDL